MDVGQCCITSVDQLFECVGQTTHLLLPKSIQRVQSNDAIAHGDVLYSLISEPSQIIQLHETTTLTADRIHCDTHSPEVNDGQTFRERPGLQNYRLRLENTLSLAKHSNRWLQVTR